MYNQGQLKVANLMLKNKVFSLKKKYGNFAGLQFYFSAKVTGQRIMYHAGEPYHTMQLDVEVVKISGPYSYLIFNNRKGNNYNRVEMIDTRNTAGFDYLMRDVASEMEQVLKILDVDIVTQVENLKISENLETEDPLQRPQITESKVPRIAIRNVIKDITTILKQKQEGEFNLPHDVDGNDFYDFIGFPEFDVLLEIIHTNFENIPQGADFYVESSYVVGDNQLQIMIRVLPDRLEKSLFAIIGKLNDDIAHELQHLRQDDEGRLEDDFFVGSTRDYFLQPDEIEAQYYGLKRRSKMTGIPVEELIDDYFEYKRDTFDLSDQDIKEIKTAILRFQSSL